MPSPIDYLYHIKIECEFIIKTVEGLEYPVFSSNEIMKRAVTRSIEIIGEAVKNIDSEFLQKHEDVEWKKLARTRDRLIHGYFGIDYEILWDIAKKHIPILLMQINDLIGILQGKEKDG